MWAAKLAGMRVCKQSNGGGGVETKGKLCSLEEKPLVSGLTQLRLIWTEVMDKMGKEGEGSVWL